MKSTRKPLRPISPRQAKRRERYRLVKIYWWALQMLLSDDGKPRCQVPGCNNPASKNPSHRHGRIGSLLCEYRLFDRLCPKHYNWPELNPADARAVGLAAPFGQFNTNPYDK